ncbi:hypothetical protein UPYG_G00067830 [Umbra pygmaea]|uniref:BTB/POZ domain-containing protein n=1 Tax=Umbra pygmaea TaxID=75934 RepID=A0ABD0XY88_UMBPY
MKPDGVPMANTEPSEPLGAEALDQCTAGDESPPDPAPSPAQPESPTAPPAASKRVNKANGKAAAELKPKTKSVGVAKPRLVTTGTKTATCPASLPGLLRPGTAPSRVANGVKPSASDLAKKAVLDKKKMTGTAGASVSAAKLPGGMAGSSTVRTQNKVADRKPAGVARPPAGTTSARNATTTGVPNRRPPPAAPSNGAAARTKNTAPRPGPTAAAKPSSTSSAARPDRTTVSKATRPATAHSGLSICPSKPTTSTGPAASKVGRTAPSTGSISTAPASKSTGPTKKVVSRPATTAATRKPVPSAAPKTSKTNPLKPPVASKPEPAIKRPPPPKAAVDAKPARPKAQDPKPLLTQKNTRPPATRQPRGKTPPASPCNRPMGTTTPRLIKQGRKPTQSVLPFATSTGTTKSTGTTAANDVSTVALTAAEEPEMTASNIAESAASLPVVILESHAEVAGPTPQDSGVLSPPQSPVRQASEIQLSPAAAAPGSPHSPAAAAPGSPHSPAAAAPGSPHSPAAAAPGSPHSPAAAAPGSPHSPAAAAPGSPLSPGATAPGSPLSPGATAPGSPLSQAKSPRDTVAQEQSVVVSAPETTQPMIDHPLPCNIPTTDSSATPSPPEKIQLTMDEEDDEEREGSQQVSVSEMSGTQPTEDSRPGSAGPAGSGWRAGGALLSELDSEEVSCSQQGASELSAPGVLEGTESTDDLGDASLKGAIDMEGMSASAGSPDFEKVPEIPTNDFEDDDDGDRVCDMEVGSEWAEDPRTGRPEDEEDEDVDMASEGVTESGLESYGNADEDDFAEDDRLDNLNRAQHRPTLPSASAPQWDQPNPVHFSDPWTPPPALVSPVEKDTVALKQSPAPAIASGQAVSQSSIVSCTEPVAHSSSETSMSEEPHDNTSSTLGCHSALGELHSPANLNRALPALGDQPYSNLVCDLTSQPPIQAAPVSPVLAPASPSADPCQNEYENVAQPWFVPADTSPGPSPASPRMNDTPDPVAISQSTVLIGSEQSSASMLEELHDYSGCSEVGKLQTSSMPEHLGEQDLESREEEEVVTLQADEVSGGPAIASTFPGGPAIASTFNPSSSSTTEDEASDTEGEAQLDELVGGQGIDNAAFDNQSGAQRCLSALVEGEETCGVGEDGGETPQSANSAASYAFDMTASNTNGHSTTESCAKSPGIYSLEELPEEAKDPSLNQELTLAYPQQEPVSVDPLLASNPEEQQYMLCGKVSVELGDTNNLKPLDPALFVVPQNPGDGPCDTQPPYYSIICEKTDNSATGLSMLPQAHHRREHHNHPAPKIHCDLLTPPRLTCADLPPRSPHMQASPQLRRLERHQQQLLEMQQRREQQGRVQEEKDEEERKKEREVEMMRKREAEEKRETQRRDLLQLQLQKQQEELQQRQQILQWQKELEEQAQQTSPQPQKGQSVALLSPSSGLQTIYEALESDEEETEIKVELGQHNGAQLEKDDDGPSQEVLNEGRADSDSACTLSPTPDSLEQGVPRDTSPCPAPGSLECSSPPPLDLDWGKKVDIVQQLINQTLLLTGDGCSSLLLLPGGGGGTLSPLEASLWPNLLPPLTPPSATVTSVSSFSPEATGQSQQGEWTVVELETHH